MEEKREKVRFLTQKQEVTDAEWVMAPTSEERYGQLMESFLLSLERRRDADKDASVSDVEKR